MAIFDPPPVELEPLDSPNHPMAPWFGHARRERRARREREPRRRRRAVLTIVHNEPDFLPRWVGYYGRFFAEQDMYVLDNDSTDGSTDGPGFVRIPVHHETVDHPWMVQTLEEHQQDLLERYDIVVVTDVDELIAPTPSLGTLGDYLDRFSEDWVNCLGYELLHLPDQEPPLRAGVPLLEQRRHWFPNDGYDKAAVATIPMSWRPGLHGRSDFQFQLDPDLRLIHLHRMDYELCLRRHRTRSARRWADRDARKGWAKHNQIVEETEFRRWFTEESTLPGHTIAIEEIPPPWRHVL